jgi:4-hydroxybutyrate dehydrogenase / sulfolactaldehyde 3-reductase
MTDSSSSASLPPIGFVGLGAMGGPMARRLLGGGYPVTAYDVIPEALRRLVEAGARPAASPREVAAASSVIVTMLPESDHVQAAVLGDDGVLSGMAPSSVLLEMSTISPAVTRQVAAELNARGRAMLDAPVGRTSRHAAEGDLLIMVGGPAELLQQVRPILERFGRDIVHCGPIGNGETMKLVNNLLTSSIVVANAEALTLGVAAGLELETVLAVLRSTAASNTHLRHTYSEKALSRDFSPGFATRLAIKDVRLAVDLASTLRLPVGVGAAALQLLVMSAAQGHESDDYTSVLTVLERLAGVELREAPTPAGALQ